MAYRGDTAKLIAGPLSGAWPIVIPAQAGIQSAAVTGSRVKPGMTKKKKGQGPFFALLALVIRQSAIAASSRQFCARQPVQADALLGGLGCQSAMHLRRNAHPEFPAVVLFR